MPKAKTDGEHGDHDHGDPVTDHVLWRWTVNRLNGMKMMSVMLMSRQWIESGESYTSSRAFEVVAVRIAADLALTGRNVTGDIS